MYVWMVLAVFMAAIFSFNIAPRDDMQDITKIPAAEGVAGKIITLHNAAISMVSQDASFSGGPVGYTAHNLTTAELNNFLPTGHCYNNGCAHDLSAEFRSKIVCLDDFNFTTGVACSAPNAANFVITWGNVPKKWLLPHVNEPDAALFKAMGKVSDNDENFGYTISYNKSNPYNNSNVGIRSAVGANNAVPEGAAIPLGQLVYVTMIR